MQLGRYAPTDSTSSCLDYNDLSLDIQCQVSSLPEARLWPGGFFVICKAPLTCWSAWGRRCTMQAIFRSPEATPQDLLFRL